MNDLLEIVRSFPHKPGVYIMKDASGAVLYIGKANDLKNRVLNYFGKGKDSRYQVGALMTHVALIEYTVTRSEKQALILEWDLIQKHKPKYNIMYRDDKSFAKIKITTYHKFPGIYVTRKVMKDGSDYFGPHPSSTSCRETAELIARYFQLRTCSDIFFANRSRPCIQYDIGRCTAPCVGYISEEKYGKAVSNAALFLKGGTAELIGILNSEMAKASESQEYERAAHLRDVIKSVRTTLGRSRTLAQKPKKPKTKWGKITEILTGKLALNMAPVNIECVDISNISGKFAVGSLVAFRKGIKNSAGYRHFKIKSAHEPDDYRMLHEVISRRFGREEKPDLLLIDGGKGQLKIAEKVFSELGIENVNLAAIAKGKNRKEDEIYVPNRKNPVNFRKSDPAYIFLKKVRDEAHRFGITLYRKKHRKGVVRSELEEISGIGPSLRIQLLKKFGSVDKIRTLSVDELKAIKGISEKLAVRIIEHLKR